MMIYIDLPIHSMMSLPTNIVFCFFHSKIAIVFFVSCGFSPVFPRSPHRPWRFLVLQAQAVRTRQRSGSQAVAAEVVQGNQGTSGLLMYDILLGTWGKKYILYL